MIESRQFAGALAADAKKLTVHSPEHTGVVALVNTATTAGVVTARVRDLHKT